MISTGILFLSNTAPRAGVSADGVFAVTLLAFDRIDTYQVEPYRITFTGANAREFWSDQHLTLLPGTALHVELDKLRTFQNGRNGACETHAIVTSISIAPKSQKHPRRDECGLKP